ncbi:hypothetical protein VTK73DRAFT_5319 [Phialemonium thermophilum]|uniref:Crotonobetainyl-CoA:carnitine CoA-transferase CaiB n=1 Tax=Phialemonium thermophilum TaxID=223376 RepID=A0ABR3Y7A2_9PEZI
MVGPPPLTGLKVVEFAGLAPGPYAGLLLSDAGASVLRVDRPALMKDTPAVPTEDLLARRKASIVVDLKNPNGVALVRALACRADVLIDPFRPGVLERLGLGPEVLLAENPGLVYARITGFRRDSRFRDMAGHDINYLAVAGVLALLGREGDGEKGNGEAGSSSGPRTRPTPPWNMLADFAGGGATLVLGILMALLWRVRTGRGQVVEANMTDGASHLATYPRVALKTPLGDRPRGQNLLDGGCPFYDTYETADGRYVAVGALEAPFFAELVRLLGLQGEGWESRRHDRTVWPALRRRLSSVFSSRTRDEWEIVFAGSDACCTPVYDYAELEAEATSSDKEQGQRKQQGPFRKEGDQRPIITLRETPCLAVRQDASDVSHGQGSGVEGGGYKPSVLAPGEGGEDILKSWMAWTKGWHYELQDVGLVLLNKPKL